MLNLAHGFDHSVVIGWVVDSHQIVRAYRNRRRALAIVVVRVLVLLRLIIRDTCNVLERSITTLFFSKWLSCTFISRYGASAGLFEYLRSVLLVFIIDLTSQNLVALMVLPI